MKVLISDKLEPGCASILENKGVEVDHKPGLSPGELQAIIPEYDGLIVRSGTRVTEALLQAGRRLRVVGRAGTGVDNIDVGAATRCGVIVMNTPGGNSVSTAEHTFAMLMSLARHIPQASASVKTGKWERGQYIGIELAGKTLGILGLGKVGREVALRGAAFKMKVLGYDPYVPRDELERREVQPVSDLADLLARADIVTCHTPHTPETHHLISEKTIARMKDGAIFINTSRGKVQDERAVFEALTRGKLRAAGLDVWEEEPTSLDNPLLNLDNVVCTPHVAGVSETANRNIAVGVASEILRVMRGEKPKALGNPDLWPRLTHLR